MLQNTRLVEKMVNFSFLNTQFSQDINIVIVFYGFYHINCILSRPKRDSSKKTKSKYFLVLAMFFDKIQFLKHFSDVGKFTGYVE